MATAPSLFGALGGAGDNLEQLVMQQRAAQYAAMPREQRRSMQAFQAGNQLGSALAGVFGVDVTDPLVKRARRLEQLRGQVDTTTPEGLRQLASLLQQEDPDTALKAVQMAQQMELQGAKLDTELSVAEKNRREKVAADPIEQFIRSNAKDFTPASLKAYKDSGGDPAVLDPIVKANIVVVEADGRVRLVDKNTKEIVKDLGAATQKGTQVNVNTKGEEEFSKQRGKDEAQLLRDATTAAQAAQQALRTIDNMASLNASNTLYTGPQANVVLETANFLSSVGLLSDTQAKKLTNSSVYDKQAKDLVMQDLGGKLGAQISDADRKFVEARIPQLTTNPKARAELLAKLREIQLGKLNVYRKMREHANKFGNLNEFDFSQDYAPILKGSPSTGGSGGWSIQRQ